MLEAAKVAVVAVRATVTVACVLAVAESEAAVVSVDTAGTTVGT